SEEAEIADVSPDVEDDACLLRKREEKLQRRVIKARPSLVTQVLGADISARSPVNFAPVGQRDREIIDHGQRVIETAAALAAQHQASRAARHPIERLDPQQPARRLPYRSHACSTSTFAGGKLSGGGRGFNATPPAHSTRFGTARREIALQR